MPEQADVIKVASTDMRLLPLAHLDITTGADVPALAGQPALTRCGTGPAVVEDMPIYDGCT
jgi:hypothetical protein